MAMSSSVIKETLAQENTQFKHLYETHQSYEKRLTQLARRPFLSVNEEQEIAELKKKKLVLKDKMYEYIEEYRRAAS